MGTRCYRRTIIGTLTFLAQFDNGMFWKRHVDQLYCRNQSYSNNTNSEATYASTDSNDENTNDAASTDSNDKNTNDAAEISNGGSDRH